MSMFWEKTQVLLKWSKMQTMNPHDLSFIVVYRQHSLPVRLMTGSVVKRYSTSTAREDNMQRMATFVWGRLIPGLESVSLSLRLVPHPSNHTMTGHVSCCFDSYQLKFVTEQPPLPLRALTIAPKTQHLSPWTETSNLVLNNNEPFDDNHRYW